MELKEGEVLGKMLIVRVTNINNIEKIECRCYCGRFQVYTEICSINNPELTRQMCRYCYKDLKIRVGWNDCTRTKNSYRSMVARCYDVNHEAFIRYSKIEKPVCDRWLHPNGLGMLNFFIDMGYRPSDKTLDRIDNNLGYSKDNCRWSTNSEQKFNIKKKENNTSGRTGVYWNKTTCKWFAYIRSEGRNKHLGYFENYDKAVTAREDAELEVYGYIKT